jgi:glycosyltransferase involved in cell wall biosynthesis
MKQNKFKIIIASYNNEDWAYYNIVSVLNQTYKNFNVVYVDDCSTDNTNSIVSDLIKNDNRFNLIRNKTNLGADGGAIYNYIRFYESLEDEEICVSMCGDDWLIDENVLENLNNYYNKYDVWMTYGEFYVYDGSEDVLKANPQNTPYPDFVHQYKLYRKDIWRASHLLTFRGFLAKKIDLNDIKSRYNNKWFYHAPDLAVAYPCLEMCPKEKIGVVDFPTYVWNSSEQCQVRTRHRESEDNMKYEIEIRNKKHYKEGLTGEKLPQINAIGGSRENNDIPKDFTYVYNMRDGEFDAVIIPDMEIIRYIEGQICIDKKCPVIADIHEPPYLFEQQRVYDTVYKNYKMFDRILTYDERLLTLPNAVFRNGGYECVLNKSVHTEEYPTLSDASLYSIYDKSKSVSIISSNKTFTDGHRYRVSCVELIRRNDQSVDIYGMGYNPINGKLIGLKDYKYSIAIENGVYKNYFTEKILDCFLTGTIPIYRGCTNILDFFNQKGIITFDTHEELLEVLKTIRNGGYDIDKTIIEENYELALKYRYDNDKIFNKYIKDLI